MPDENELYAMWLAANPRERGQIEEKLHPVIRAHARAVVSKKFPEARFELPDYIADTVLFQLTKFRRECKFSTWVHKISVRMTDEELRRLIRSRKVFDRTKVVPRVAEEEPGYVRGSEYPIVLPKFDSRIAFRELFPPLSQDQRKLLRYKIRHVPSSKIAKKLRISQEAVDSRWARLKPQLKKMLANATV
jgi:RNA polymerase sigma factor (sigma-70 family)